MNIIEECDTACDSIALDLWPERIDGHGGATSVKMRYDGCQARDLRCDGNAGGVHIASDCAQVGPLSDS
jgi:hypothetical protein